MSLQQLIFGFAVAMLVVVWYSTATLREKIFVTYTRVDGTEEEFFARISSRYLVFDHKRFTIIRKCIRYLWYKRSIHRFFPTRVAALHYVWNSEFPIDPETGQVYITSPEARAVMNQEEKFIAYNRAQAKVSGQKEGFIKRNGAIIAIILVVIVGVYLYMQVQGLNNSITILANAYKSLAK
jgi:hypothetical protein